MESTPSLPRTPFTIAEVRGRGITRQTVRRMLAAGQVRQSFRGVYVAADLDDTIELRALTIARIAPRHHVACDRTAAWIHRIDLFTYGELDGIPEIETCARRGHASSQREGVDGCTRDLADTDIMMINGIRVTTPLRTALDLGCILERRDALAALDAFRRQHGLGLGVLTAEARRFRRRRGVVQLRDLIPLSDPRAESKRESWTRLAIHDAGLPPPEPQVWVIVDGVRRYRLDLAYERRRIAIEYDGFDVHERTTEQIEYDEARRGWLREHGWTVIVIRQGDFTGAALDRWLREVREALATTTYSNKRRLERGSRR